MSESHDPLTIGGLTVRYLIDGAATKSTGVFELSPDLGAQYFRNVPAIVAAGGPPDRQKFLAVMSRYGLVPAMPSPAVAHPGVQG